MIKKNIVIISWGFSLILFLLNSYLIYTEVLVNIIIQNGQLTIADGHYVPMPKSLALYFCFFCLAILIAIFGLLFRRLWGYFLFNIFGLSAGLAFILEGYSAYINAQMIPVIHLVAMLSIFIFVFILNRYRDSLIKSNLNLKVKGLLIILLGMVVNFAIFYAILVINKP